MFDITPYLHPRRLEKPQGSIERKKFYPYSIDESIELLRPQIDALDTNISKKLRGDRIIFQLGIIPNYTAPTYYPFSLFCFLDVFPIGNRLVSDLYYSKIKAPKLMSTTSWSLAGTKKSFDLLAKLFNNNNAPNVVLKQLRYVSSVGITYPEMIFHSNIEILRVEQETYLEICLHPDPDLSNNNNTVQLSNLLYKKFTQYVRSLGGDVINSVVFPPLTYVIIKMPTEQLDQLTQFNIIRKISPCARIELR